MIHREQARLATTAEQFMAIEVFTELLASTDPALVGKNLTEQLREVTGARTVLLVKHPERTEEHTLIHASPERREKLFSPDELELLCPGGYPGILPRMTLEFPDENPLKKLLQEKGITSLLLFPLSEKNELIATLFLFDLPGMERIDETVAIVTRLSPMIALSLKNSLSHERIEKQAAELGLLTGKLEQRVAERTAQLEEANAKLNKSLREKETLLRELYHRTKNTLQIISGILKLQAAQITKNPEVEQLVEITDNRIQAISLVHQMLYTSNDLSRISIREYIRNLTALILQGHGIEQDRISLSLEIAEHDFLLDTAIPLGLTLTELMTNSYKYAFPDNRKGKITISLYVDTDQNATITYSDDGIGVAENFDFASQPSLGLQLIFNIVTEQLQGTVNFVNKNGLTCILTIPKTEYSTRI